MTTPTNRIGSNPHDVQAESKPSSFLVFAVALALVLVVGLASFMAGSEAAASSRGEIAIGSDSYAFEASTCTISDSDFVVAGPGVINGEPFWLSASSRTITMAAGVESELERPANERLWLSSEGAINWSVDDNTLTAETVVLDVRAPQRAIPASLAITCDS